MASPSSHHILQRKGKGNKKWMVMLPHSRDAVRAPTSHRVDGSYARELLEVLIPAQHETVNHAWVGGNHVEEGATVGSMTLASLVRTYICAKDRNRPHLVSRVFSPTAWVEMVVKTDAMAFDPGAQGPEAISELLVRRFAQQYDNVYTFCLCEPPPSAALRLDCGWLVVMSDKETRELRAGFGRYVWEWQPAVEPRVQRLTITIERMDRFDPARRAAAFEWAERLPYPWCPVGRAAGAPTPLDAVVAEAVAQA